LGGGRLWGALFGKKRASKNFFPETFTGYITFFPKYEKLFPDIPKKFLDI
jgi:hypothetical protein